MTNGTHSAAMTPNDVSKIICITIITLAMTPIDVSNLSRDKPNANEVPGQHLY